MKLWSSWRLGAFFSRSWTRTLQSRHFATSDLVVFNSLSGNKEPLEPIDGKLTWYVCGPTVYDVAHLGHARIVRRFADVPMETMMNITNVDDKILNRASESGVTAMALSDKFEKLFWDDMKLPSAILRVTDHLPEMIDMIRQLVLTGRAYVEDGSVYYDPAKQGPTSANKLHPSGQTPTQVSPDKDAAFALWRDGGPFESPWGPGRPGWHIECTSLVTTRHSSLSVHAGGIDLAFPHHHNEILQAEAFHGHAGWAKHFIHFGHLHITGRKMSKSLKNFISIKEYLEHNTGDHLRLLCLQSLQNAVRLQEIFQHALSLPSSVDNVKIGSEEAQLLQSLAEAEAAARAALLDDFDTPTAVQHMQHLANALLRYNRDHAVVASVQAWLRESLAGLGLRFVQAQATATQGPATQPLLDLLLQFRFQVRQTAKEKRVTELLQLCDKARDDLAKLGVKVNDRSDTSTAVMTDKAA